MVAGNPLSMPNLPPVIHILSLRIAYDSKAAESDFTEIPVMPRIKKFHTPCTTIELFTVSLAYVTDENITPTAIPASSNCRISIMLIPPDICNRANTADGTNAAIFLFHRISTNFMIYPRKSISSQTPADNPRLTAKHSFSCIFMLLTDNVPFIK